MIQFKVLDEYTLLCEIDTIRVYAAPGYMDCTEWAVFKTEEEAKRYLKDVYGEEE